MALAHLKGALPVDVEPLGLVLQEAAFPRPMVEAPAGAFAALGVLIEGVVRNLAAQPLALALARHQAGQIVGDAAFLGAAQRDDGVRQNDALLRPGGLLFDLGIVSVQGVDEDGDGVIRWPDILAGDDRQPAPQEVVVLGGELQRPVHGGLLVAAADLFLERRGDLEKIVAQRRGEMIRRRRRRLGHRRPSWSGE